MKVVSHLLNVDTDIITTETKITALAIDGFLSEISGPHTAGRTIRSTMDGNRQIGCNPSTRSCFQSLLQWTLLSYEPSGQTWCCNACKRFWVAITTVTNRSIDGGRLKVYSDCPRRLPAGQRHRRSSSWGSGGELGSGSLIGFQPSGSRKQSSIYVLKSIETYALRRNQAAPARLFGSFCPRKFHSSLSLSSKVIRLEWICSRADAIWYILLLLTRLEQMIFQQPNGKQPKCWIFRINLNDHADVLYKETRNFSGSCDEALHFFVDKLL